MRWMVWGTMLFVAATASGCASKPSYVSVVRWYGTHSLDEQVELQVSTLGLSQIQFEFVNAQPLATLNVSMKAAGASARKIGAAPVH